MVECVTRNYQIRYTIIAPSGERYTPTEIMIYTCSAKQAIEVVKGEIKRRMGTHYKFEVISEERGQISVLRYMYVLRLCANT
ncbi:hypothetical protein CN345_07095 [Bacillus thuringiensis]|uniref:hypothetical protein n=1 Tax=Bacillus thuringiensis TaxID=1428 RepID=UPI000BF7F049|nr:hypothetical protein [Bacillus thuringiensis]PES12024.1 hypothetical protein CN488_29265 [Bacillus anthracis]PEZ41807.1 hypothetical protein CN345_07095 [Bacillus thuringiensis]PGY51082.1 hypothetical protein COE09_18035 [Bacillus thuringiensis]